MQHYIRFESIQRYIKLLGKNPEGDWKILFSIFGGFTFLLCAFSGFMLYQINAGEIFLAEKKDYQALRTIDRTKLKMLMDQFGASDRRFEMLKAEKPVLVDPGL